MTRIGITTLGCKTNLVESDALESILRAEGFEIVDFDSEAEFYIVNTCTVTHVSDRKSRQMLRRAKRHNPNAKLICMGCYSQLNPADVEALGEADLILGNNNKHVAIEYIRSGGHTLPNAQRTDSNQVVGIATEMEPASTVLISDLSEYEDIPIYGATKHTRAFLKIQEGCEQYCTYCIIPYARGKIRSRKLESIQEEVERLISLGYAEFVLTGIHLMSYGRDWTKHGAENPYEEPKSLIDVLELLESIDGVKRIRLGSLEPRFIDGEFKTRAGKLTKLCDHFHLSLQSGSDAVLKKMNRHYSTEEYLDALAMLREMYDMPSITTDIIVGFPGEGESEFEETLAFVEKAGFSDVHVFPYSERSGTPAVKFTGKVPEETKKERVHRLLEKVEESKQNYLASFGGKTLEILVEEIDEGIVKGYTRNYIYIEQPVETLAQTRDPIYPNFHPSNNSYGDSDDNTKCRNHNIGVGDLVMVEYFKM